MSKYKIISFLLMVVGLVLVLIGLNSDKPTGNVAGNNNTPTEPVIVDQPTVVEPITEPEPSTQITEGKSGYWYENEADAGSYVHLISANTGSQLEFDWVVMEKADDGQYNTTLQTLAQVADFSADDSLYHFNYNDVYYTININEDNVIVVSDGTTENTYAYYQESAR